MASLVQVVRQKWLCMDIFKKNIPKAGEQKWLGQRSYNKCSEYKMWFQEYNLLSFVEGIKHTGRQPLISISAEGFSIAWENSQILLTASHYGEKKRKQFKMWANALLSNNRVTCTGLRLSQVDSTLRFPEKRFPAWTQHYR